MTLTPSAATVGGNGQVDMVATVTGGSTADVTWSATSGSVLATGIGKARFTAGLTDAVITATSLANPSVTKSLSVTVMPGLATVKGKVVQNDSQAGIPGIVLELRDAGANVLATATTDGSGNFSVAVSAAAVRFHLRSSSMPNAYYKDYKYNTKHYAPLVATCSAPLPTLAANTSANLVTTVVLYRTYEPPPPPPTGCS